MPGRRAPAASRAGGRRAAGLAGRSQGGKGVHAPGLPNCRKAPRKIADSESIRSTRAAVTAVQPGSFLTLHYRLAGPDGADVVNTFADKPATLSLGTGELAPA